MAGANRRTAEAVGLVVLVLTAVPGFWSTFVPSLHDVATADGDPEQTRRWVRRGEAHAIGLSLGLGVGASVLAGEPWPLFGAGAMCVYLARLYEGALRHNGGSGAGH
jgi:hypothetical protein